MTLNNPQLPTGTDDNTETVKDEIDIVDLIRPLWRHKLLIITVTAIAVALAGAFILLATPQYRIYTQLKSGTSRWSPDGTPVPYMKTYDLKNLLNGGIFETYSAELGFKPAPEMTVTSTRRGNQLRVAIFWPDPAEGKKILNGYIKFLNNSDRNNNSSGRTSGLQNQRNSLQKLIQATLGEIEENNLKQQIIALDIEQKKEELKLIDLKKDLLKRDIGRINTDLKMTKEQIELLQERIKVAEETRAGYIENRLEIEANTAKIIALRDKLLQTPGNDSLQLLLLANTIQQNIAYLDTIDQKIETTRKEVISYRMEITKWVKNQGKNHLSIADLQAKIDIEIPKHKSDIAKEITKLKWKIEKKIPNETALLQQKIDELNEKIRTIALVEVIEYPQASPKPVKPKRRKIITFAGAMGGFIAIICAYSRHFWLTNRKRLMSNAGSN